MSVNPTAATGFQCGTDACERALAAEVGSIPDGFHGSFAFPHVTTMYACTRS